MTGLLPGLLILGLLVVGSWAVLGLAPAQNGRRRADGDRRQGDDDRSADFVAAAQVSAIAAPWLGRTWPAPPAALPPRRPRVSAGRVTVANLIRYQYALADQPVCQVLAAYGWPAQEVWQ